MSGCNRILEEEKEIFAGLLKKRDLSYLEFIAGENKKRLVEIGRLISVAADTIPEDLSWLSYDIQMSAVRLDCLITELKNRLETREKIDVNMSSTNINTTAAAGHFSTNTFLPELFLQ